MSQLPIDQFHENITTDAALKYLRSSDSMATATRDAKSAGLQFIWVAADENLSEFVWLLGHCGVARESDFDNIVSQNQRMIRRFFELMVTRSKTAKKVRWAVNEAFIGQIVLALEFTDLINDDVVARLGWDDNIAQIILGCAKAVRSVERS